MKCPSKQLLLNDRGISSSWLRRFPQCQRNEGLRSVPTMGLIPFGKLYKALAFSRLHLIILQTFLKKPAMI